MKDMINFPVAIQMVLIALGSLGLGFLLRERLSDAKAEKNEFKAILKANTTAITELRVEMKLTREALSIVQELERDVQKLAAKIRDSQRSVPERE